MSELHWYALRTRARAEKQVDAFLERAGVESWPALVRVERQWSDRVRRVEVPLFPGYLFVRTALSAQAAVLRAPGAAGWVRGERGPARLRPEEIEAIRILVHGVHQTGALPEAADLLQLGDPVRVVRGPFQGLEGVLVAAHGGGRVLVRIPSLRLARGIRVDRAHLHLRTPGAGTAVA